MSVRVEKNGAVWTAIQSRAEARNAVDPQTAEALADDLHPMRNIAYPLDDRPPPRGPMGPTRLELYKSVIGAIAGPAVAGGFELALWCDLRVMEESAYFGVYCRRRGGLSHRGLRKSGSGGGLAGARPRRWRAKSHVFRRPASAPTGVPCGCRRGSKHVTRCAGSGTRVSWRLLRKALQERTASRRGGAGTETSKTSDSGLSRQPLRRANV